ncbi:MAG: OmpA family protein [Thermodesulfobacteriota bacterium]
MIRPVGLEPALLGALGLVIGLWLGLTPAPAAGLKFFSLQVGSRPSAQDAAQAVAAFKALGLEAFSRYEDTDGRGRGHRVYVGLTAEKREAEELAQNLRNQGLISNYRIVEMADPNISTPKPASRSGRAAIDSSSRNSDRNLSSFQRLVSGRFVGSFRDREQAAVEAEGLTRSGWPASVSEEKVQGVMWYRVYLLAPGGRDYSGEPVAAEPSGVELMADMSEPGRGLNSKPQADEPSRCPGFTRRGAKIALLRAINDAVPERPSLAALRELALEPLDKTADYLAALRERASNLGRLNPADHTRLAWGVLAYDRSGLDKAMDRLRSGDGPAPLVWALAAAETDLEAMKGRKTLIIVSDFNQPWAAEDPVAKAGRLKARYGENLCLSVLYLEADAAGVKLAEDLAQAGGCGRAHDGCRALADKSSLESLFQESGLESVAGRPASSCPDADADGVCDDLDLCPHTPRGALVDDHGCWVAALGPFFDFNQDTVRPEFLPGIKWAADVILENPGLVVEVAGHTDSLGGEAYNRNLGRRRGETVRSWLIRHGVNPSRLTVRSYGESRPAADNATEQGRARNRRVELHVIK